MTTAPVPDPAVPVPPPVRLAERRVSRRVAAITPSATLAVDARAWAIATPADVGTALDELPAALAVLQRAGALDPEDLPG